MPNPCRAQMPLKVFLFQQVANFTSPFRHCIPMRESSPWNLAPLRLNDQLGGFLDAQ